MEDRRNNKEIVTELKKINEWQKQHEIKDTDAFKEIRETHNQDHIELVAMIKELNEKIDPVAELFSNMNFSRKSFVWVLGIIATIVGIIIGLLNIAKLLK